MRAFYQWINDWRWAMNVKRARAWRRNIHFSARKRFDDAIRHPIGPGSVIAYPDAFYYVEIDDLCRAMEASASSLLYPPKE
jgi:hypothetical protein